MNTTPIEKCAIGLEAEYDVKVATERGWSKFGIFSNGNLIDTSPMGETETPVPQYRRMLNDAAPDLLECLVDYLGWHDGDESSETMKRWLDVDGLPAMRAAVLKATGKG